MTFIDGPRVRKRRNGAENWVRVTEISVLVTPDKVLNRII